MKLQVYGYDGYGYLYKGILYKVWKVEKSYNATTFEWYIKCNDNDGTDVLDERVGSHSYTSRGAAIDNAKYYIDKYLTRISLVYPNPVDFGFTDYNDAMAIDTRLNSLDRHARKNAFSLALFRWMEQEMKKKEL